MDPLTFRAFYILLSDLNKFMENTIFNIGIVNKEVKYPYYHHKAIFYGGFDKA